ncbi:MAG: T9SS type A sorting domain-containing protein [candidate division Zixibacteria bacterium]|nr:T9SS type A sorting domain-containing protein [candidate division Zixibacteria bacterium]
MAPPPPVKKGNPGSELMVQVETSDGTWQSLDSLPSRGNAEDALWLIDPGSGRTAGQEFRVRLRWTMGFRADQIAYYRASKDSLSIAIRGPIAANHSSRGDVVSEVAAADGHAVILAPGETLELAFPASANPAPPAGWIRSFVLKSTGRYDAIDAAIPADAVLSQNYPNPFNAGTNISFVLKQREQATLAIYNVLGQRIVTLMEGDLEPGTHTYSWEGRDANGEASPSGVYLYRLTRADGQETRKMTLLR